MTMALNIYNARDWFTEWQLERYHPVCVVGGNNWQGVVVEYNGHGSGLGFGCFVRERGESYGRGSFATHGHALTRRSAVENAVSRLRRYFGLALPGDAAYTMTCENDAEGDRE